MNDILRELDGIGAETGDALDRFLDDREMYLKYVRNFPDEPTMPALVAAVARCDYSAAEKAVHALKGIVNNLGFLPLADASVEMLLALREGQVDEALDAFEDVKKQYRRFCDVIHAWNE
ncbi:MAG: hypothetical protein SPD11_12095 [Sphaerochaetaceae bacterium]|nr:hypothetical protein [Sphaerochaetaceae bacterium]